MNKRPDSVMSYDYAFACYPKSFVGTVVSPTKICIQYGNVQVKLRPQGNSVDHLAKGTYGHFIPMYQNGSDIQVVAMGAQMPELEAMHIGLLQAYETYIKTHYETYTKTYDRKFLDHLRRIQVDINRLVGIAINVEQGIDNK